MIKFLLQGEGPTDCGTVDYNTGKLLEGPIPVYLRKILPEADIEVTSRDIKKRPRAQRSLKGLNGHGPRAFFLGLEAVDGKFDAAALYIDADKSQAADARKEHECQKRYNDIKTEIMEGFSRIREQSLQYVVIIPMKMIESWMMGDPEAFDKAFQVKGRGKKNFGKKDFPTKPELDWGAKEDVNGNYPKHRLARILEHYQKAPCREVFYEIAMHSDIETLCETCPISFKDFRDQLVRCNKHGEKDYEH